MPYDERSNVSERVSIREIRKCLWIYPHTNQQLNEGQTADTRPTSMLALSLSLLHSLVIVRTNLLLANAGEWDKSTKAIIVALQCISDCNDQIVCENYKFVWVRLKPAKWFRELCNARSILRSICLVFLVFVGRPVLCGAQKVSNGVMMFESECGVRVRACYRYASKRDSFFRWFTGL